MTLLYSSALIQGKDGDDYSRYCLFLGEVALLSPRHTVLALNMDIANSPVSSCLISNPSRKTNGHFYHIDVIQGCFEELVILVLAALHV